MIIAGCAIAYLLLGSVMGAYSRSRSYNKAFKRWLTSNSYHTRELQLIETHMTVMKYDHGEISMTGVLGAIFWPVFAVGFGFHFLYKKLEAFITPKLPTSGYELEVRGLLAKKARKEELEEELKNLRALMREARDKGIDVTGLDQLVRIAESKNKTS